jgi:Flp pilus assembly pilin Flp
MDGRSGWYGLPAPIPGDDHLITRFTTEDGGQDLVEYALLAAFIGIAGWAVLLTLPSVIGATYASWLDPTNGVPGRWDPPEPGAGS